MLAGSGSVSLQTTVKGFCCKTSSLSWDNRWDTAADGQRCKSFRAELLLNHPELRDKTPTGERFSHKMRSTGGKIKEVCSCSGIKLLVYGQL